MMSKQQRLYYEYSNKERLREELRESVKQIREVEVKKFNVAYCPHKNSYFD